MTQDFKLRLQQQNSQSIYTTIHITISQFSLNQWNNFPASPSMPDFGIVVVKKERWQPKR